MIKRIFFLVAVFCCIHTVAVQAQWVAKEKKGKYGYVDPVSGKTMIPYQYPFVYSDTLTTIAFVAVDDKIKAIDKDNKQLFTVLTYDSGPDYLEEGLFRIVDDASRKMGFANEKGEIVISPIYDFVTPFSEGLAAFNQGGHSERLEDGHSVIVDGLWGYINQKGEIVFPAIFDSAWSFSHKKVDVSIAGRRFLLEVDE